MAYDVVIEYYTMAVAHTFLFKQRLVVPGENSEQGLKQVEQCDCDDALEPRNEERGRECRAAGQELLVHEDEGD